MWSMTNLYHQNTFCETKFYLERIQVAVFCLQTRERCRPNQLRSHPTDVAEHPSVTKKRLSRNGPTLESETLFRHAGIKNCPQKHADFGVQPTLGQCKLNHFPLEWRDPFLPIMSTFPIPLWYVHLGCTCCYGYTLNLRSVSLFS